MVRGRRFGRSSGSAYDVTVARLGDLDQLVEHRLGMWRDIHPELENEIAGTRGHTRSWIREKLSKGELVGFVARTSDKRVAGSGCIWLREEQPRPDNPLRVVPYLMSMYTEKEFRRRGVAKAVLEEALNWTRAHNHRRIVLHASDEGRHLYEEYGFGPTHEMRLDL